MANEPQGNGYSLDFTGWFRRVAGLPETPDPVAQSATPAYQPPIDTRTGQPYSAGPSKYDDPTLNMDDEVASWTPEENYTRRGRFIPEPQIEPLGPAINAGQQRPMDEGEDSINGVWRTNREPHYAHNDSSGIDQPVVPWTPPGTRNRPVQGVVEEWTQPDEGDVPPPIYGPTDPAERNRAQPGYVYEGTPGKRYPDENRYPNIINDQQQAPTLPKSILESFRAVNGRDPNPEEAAQLGQALMNLGLK